MCNNNWLGSSLSSEQGMDGSITAYVPVTFSYNVSAGDVVMSNDNDDDSDMDSGCGCGCNFNNSSRNRNCGCNQGRSDCGCRRSCCRW